MVKSQENQYSANGSARLGADGFKLSVKTARGDKGRSDAISVDTTVQEKNITYPTDAKL